MPRKLFEHEAAWPSVQTFSEGPVKCKCNENNRCDRYSCSFTWLQSLFLQFYLTPIVILAVLPDSSLKLHRKRRKVFKAIVFRKLNLVIQSCVGLQNRTSKTIFPLTTSMSTKGQTKCSFRAATLCRETSCNQTWTRLEDFQVKTKYNATEAESQEDNPFAATAEYKKLIFREYKHTSLNQKCFVTVKMISESICTVAILQQNVL